MVPRRLLVALLCALAALLPLPVLAVPAYAEAPIAWGAHPYRRSGETAQDALQRQEGLAGRTLESVRLFYRWDDPWPTSFENTLKANGQTLVISVKSRLRNGGSVPWAQVAAARPGSQRYNEIVGWARRVRDFGVPIYVTFNHEPEANANLDLGNASDFLAAWRNWVTIFRQEGATNAKFMWIMTDQSFWLPASDRRAAARWYPGDEWVDGIAGDAYNWFTCRPGINNPWKPLRDIIDPQRRFWLNHTSEELWLTEYGTVEDPAVAGRKAQWYSDAQALFKTPEFAVFDGVMLFESADPNCRWAADTSPSAAAAWRDWGQDPFYGGAGTSPPPTRSAALVVGDAAALGADASVVDRLRARGYTVDVHDDNTVTAAAVADVSVVLVSQSVSQAQLGRKLRDVATAVVLWKPSVYDDMGMSPTAGASLSRTSIAITAPTHPLAAGRTGTVAIVTSSTQLPYGSVVAGATVVATLDGQPSLFVYPAGAAMSGIIAPACRLAFPMQSAGIPRLTADGLALFDRAVDHAADGCP
jgi:hypothetical protein